MRKKTRGGLLDVFIAATILLSVVGVLLRMQALRVVEDADTEIAVRATAYALASESVACMTVGETVYLEDGTAFGVLEAVESMPAQIRMQDGDRILTGEWDDGSYLDATLTITVSGRMGESGFLRDGGHALLIGDRLTLRGERFCFAVVLVGVGA